MTYILKLLVQQNQKEYINLQLHVQIVMKINC